MRFGIIFIVGWMAISSVQAAPAEPSVPFSRALDAIIDSHAPLGAQRAQVEAARARLMGARAIFLPQLALSSSRIRSADPHVDRRSTEASATLNLFKFGADVSGLNATAADFEEQSSRLTAAQLKAETDAVNALVTWIERVNQLRIAQSSVEAVRQYASIAKARYARGVLPQEEVDKTSIDLANAEASLQNAQSRLQEARGALHGLVHERFALAPEQIDVAWPWKERFAQENVRRWASAQVDRELSPEFRSEQAALRSQEHVARQAFRSIFPSVDLSYSWQRLELDPGAATTAREAMITLSMPLFEGLTDYAAYKVQSAQAVASRYAFELAFRQVPAAQETAQKNFMIAHETALAREKNLVVARRLLASGTKRFEVGRAKADELSQDQARVNQAELLAVEGWANTHRALTTLLHAFGQSVR